MRQKNCIQLVSTLALALAVVVVPMRAQQQTAAQEGMSTSQPEIQAVSKTGLLPIYGVDFRFDPGWVDGTQFPSQSADFPNFGVNTMFQQVWDNLKPTGFNVLRLPVDVNHAQDAPTRVANLCVWARNNNVKLVLVLVGARSGQSDADDYGSKVSAFVKALVSALRAGEGKYLENYPQIVAYQLEDELNHAGRHGGMSPSAGQQLLLRAAQRLRDSERETLKGTGLDATPQLVNVSFDYELVRAKAIAGVPLSENAYNQAYGTLKQFLSGFAASPNIDLIGVDWFAGSVGAGEVDRFPSLLAGLTGDFPGKQFVFTTGFSQAFHTADEQKQFYGMAFANLADYRAGVGVDCMFVGLFYREALNGAEPNPEPPKPALPAQVAKWDWSAKADELAQMWNGAERSAEMAWWVKKVENNMGLLNLQTDVSGTPYATPQPAQRALSQIASAVRDASAASTLGTSGNEFTQSVAVPGAGTGTGAPAFGQGFSSHFQQAMMGLLDVVFQRLGNMVASAVAGSNRAGGSSQGPPYPSAPPSGQPWSQPGAFGPSISLTKQDVTIQPTNPRVGQAVAIMANLTNRGPAVAPGLVIVAMDEDNAWLAYADNLSVPANATYPVSLQWTPAQAPASYRISIRVADSSGNELASVSLDPLSVAPSPSGASTGTVAPTGTTGAADGPQSRTSGIGTPTAGGASGPWPQVFLPLGAVKLAALSIGLLASQLVAGQPAPVSISFSNPYQVPLQNIKATLIVDGRTVESRKIGLLLPHQTRSVVFPEVTFGQAGQHEIRISLESQRPQGNPQKGFVTSQFVVRSKAVTPAGGGSGVRPVISSSGGANSALTHGDGMTTKSTLFRGRVRSVLPAAYHVGQLAVRSDSKVADVGREAESKVTPAGTGKASEPQPAPSPPTLGAATALVADASSPAGPGPARATSAAPMSAPATSSRTPTTTSAPRAVLPPRPGPTGTRSTTAPPTSGARLGTLTPGSAASPPAGAGILSRPGPTGAATTINSAAPVTGERATGTASPATSAPGNLDLAVSTSDIHFTPASPRSGQPTTFTAVVRNIGTSEAQGASVVFRLIADGRQAAISQPMVFNIATHGIFRATWSTPIPPGQQMQVVVSVTADRDVNPANNQATVSFAVAPASQPPTRR